MDAIVIAGGIPNPEDPLYTYVKGDAKALVDIAGKPMVQWVLDALGGAARVDNIILVGLSPKNQLVCKKPLHYLPNQGRMLSNIVAGTAKSLELNKKNKYVLVVSSDIPALKSHMVDWLVDTCMQTKDDLYYGICPRDVMEKRYPDSKRTYTKLKDIEVCGGDLHVSHVRMTTEHLDMWEQLIGNRKSPFRQARVIGLGTMLAYFTGRMTLADAEARASKRIGIKGRVIQYPFAEPAMDVDKPNQLELLRTDLAKQQRKTARAESKPKSGKAVAHPKKKRLQVTKKAAASKSSRTKLKPKSRRK